MTEPLNPHRRLIAKVAGTLLFVPAAFGDAWARTGGDWLDMVKAQHASIAKTFDALVESGEGEGLYARRDRLVQTLSFQLTAHSVAEENVLYPAIAMAGLVPESDKLYLDQAHAKVMNAQLQFADAVRRRSPEWLGTAKALQAAVLAHATGDEEQQLYPRLRQALDAKRNAALTDAFEREFVAVKARTWATS